jgi:hypothetical protein
MIVFVEELEMLEMCSPFLIIKLIFAVMPFAIEGFLVLVWIQQAA